MAATPWVCAGLILAGGNRFTIQFSRGDLERFNLALANRGAA